MALTAYTTYDEVRAALGVTSEELADTTLGLQIYELSLLADMEEVGATLAADYATVAAIGAGSRTEAEKAFYDSVRLYAPYGVAQTLVQSLPMFGPKSVTDGKAGITRFSESPYKDTIKACNAAYDKYRRRLAAKYAAYKSSGVNVSTAYAMLGAVAPDTDPITGV